MGAGIARQFRELFPEIANYCLAQKPVVGLAVKYQTNNRIIFNLVTKNRYYEKPTYHALEKSLAHMKSQILSQGITKLAMPLIGCGLDKLVWSKVAQIIRDTFEETDIEILICRL
jgi:O-acetyl-ADP-ribose deacetylase (regulator of RNase III)